MRPLPDVETLCSELRRIKGEDDPVPESVQERPVLGDVVLGERDQNGDVHAKVADDWAALYAKVKELRQGAVDGYELACQSGDARLTYLHSVELEAFATVLAVMNSRGEKEGS